MNNIDIAEAMIECVKQVLKTNDPSLIVTWGDLLTALERYIIAERHEIEKLRKLK